MKRIVSRFTLLIPVLFVLMLSPAFADTLQVDEYQVTWSSAIETTPTIGNDGTSDLVVYTVQPIISGVPGAADIWYQPLVDGAPSGFPMPVTSADTDDQLNDVWGDYIVYTAFDSATSLSGTIMLYQISTHDLWPIASAMIIQEPRIHGNYVVLREGGYFATQVMLYDLRWLGTSKDPIILVGPVPTTWDVQIGNRFAVWAEFNGDQYDIMAYDLTDYTFTPFAVTSSADVDETTPAISGPWVVWKSQGFGALTSTIEGTNLDTSETRVIADNGAGNYNPSIDGDLVTWESDLNGNLDIFVYRISTGETFQVTTDPANQYLNDVFGDLVAYIDTRGLTADIYVSKLYFISPTCYHDLSAPELTVTGKEDYTLPGGEEYTRYRLSVTNWSEFPDELFEAAPDLPPCGENPNASRTWVNIYEEDGTYRYGFCALSSSQNLEYTLWFSVPKGDAPPEYVYITLVDRRCELTYTSNLAWTNIRPVADAGEDQIVHAGDTATLYGSGSSDPDENYPLSYTWNISSTPAGSAAELSDPESVNPSFTADMMGDYIMELTVTDSLGLSSVADSVLVSTSNTPPIADAGIDQAVIVPGTTVQLDGTQSYDLEGDPITYAWTITQKPVGSMGSLSDPDSPTPTFVADVKGTYEIELVVSDLWDLSEPDFVVVSFENVKPNADAGGNQSALAGDTVVLDGTGSTDANEDELTYSWNFASKPVGSTATLLNPIDSITSFVTDLPGTYVISLVVNDGLVDSDPNNATVTATAKQDEIILILQNGITGINDFPPTVFRNSNMVNALTNKINAAIKMVDQERYQDALDKLENDILKKTDGCDTQGAPDKNDWIKDCESQAEVYSTIVEAIELLRDLI